MNSNIIIFHRIHWIKQIHTRTVVRDGVIQEQRTTERVLINQHGDAPPKQLQDSIDKLAEEFKAYDIRPSSSSTT